MPTQPSVQHSNATGMCPDCATHEAELCAVCHTAVGCQAGLSGHDCLVAAA